MIRGGGGGKLVPGGTNLVAVLILGGATWWGTKFGMTVQQKSGHLKPSDNGHSLQNSHSHQHSTLLSSEPLVLPEDLPILCHKAQAVW